MEHTRLWKTLSAAQSGAPPDAPNPSALGFSFYTRDAAKKLSVARLTPRAHRDVMGNPVHGGLYDPRMGPTDHDETCPTCSLDYSLCPGHLGHIELPLPVYAPLLFPLAKQLLAASCSRCGTLRAADERVEPYCDVMVLLAEGLLADAASLLERAQLEEAGNKHEERVAQPYLASLSSAARKSLRRAARASARAADDTSYAAVQSPRAAESPHLLSLRKLAVRGLTNQLRSARKCSHCGWLSRSLRSQSGKIFCVPLSEAQAAHNSALGDEAGAVSELEDGGETPRRHGEADGNLEGDEDMVEYPTPPPLPTPPPTAGELATEDAFLTPSEAERRLGRLWRKSGNYLRRAYPHLSAEHFFCRVVLVPPNRFRPPSKLGDEVYDHPQNVWLGKILASIDALNTLSAAATEADAAHADKLLEAWDEMGGAVCGLIDSSTAKSSAEAANLGIKQVIERKEGLFRSNMMGKRVNFAARSVISPDPYIDADEIGVPIHFATTLTYPERVTPLNVELLRKAVENGPHTHPGANYVEDASGDLIDLSRRSRPQRVAIAKRLLASDGTDDPMTPLSGTPISFASGTPATPHASLLTQQSLGAKSPAALTPVRAPAVGRARGKTVWRHLHSGDMLLVNRQPTLHKPGIMAHRARVLRNERVIRMHYANCNTYNADFDGDEMNLHLAQSPLAIAEAKHIAATTEQYIAPTNGRPLRGLIQDHIVMGVLLTKRDTFLERGEFMQLLYASSLKPTGGRFVVPPPAVLRPRPLWTGKQLFSTLLIAIHPEARHLNVEAKAKTSADCWRYLSRAAAGDADEARVIVCEGELLSGVLDKASFGATEFGLVHSVQETLGGESASRLLSVVSRLLTYYQQIHGFTCGLADLLLTEEADAARTRLLLRADAEGVAAAEKFAELPPGALATATMASRGLGAQGDEELQEANATARAPFLSALAAKIGVDGGDAAAAALDNGMKQALMPLSSDAVAECLPKGQVVPFPRNQFALMTQTGAKGSGVNFSQISVMLGQQELEGRRVPVSPSGATAPCFAPFELSARAGGYITDRFLTGVRPPEFYFHCMAGREGLIDTAVKTSRSGYLQRCLVKHLEPLVVGYDHTVRSSADGSLVSIVAGEDGLDPTLVSFLQTPAFFGMNARSLWRRLAPSAPPTSVAGRLDVAAAHAAHAERVARPIESRPLLHELTFPSSRLGCVSPHFEELVESVIDEVAKLPKGSGRALPDAAFLREVMWFKYYASLATPGDSVGVVAAQSVGEPSTQMTLNTFHLAGTGLANVTLGIPRLRELLMTAARNPSTPLMKLPLRPEHSDRKEAVANELCAHLERLSLKDVLHQVVAEERLTTVDEPSSVTADLPLRRRVRVTIHLKLRGRCAIEEVYKPFTKQLLPEMKAAVVAHSDGGQRRMRGSSKAVKAKAAIPEVRSAGGGDGQRDGSGEDAEEAEGDTTEAAKVERQRTRPGHLDEDDDMGGAVSSDGEEDDTRAVAGRQRGSVGDYEDDEPAEDEPDEQDAGEADASRISDNDEGVDPVAAAAQLALLQTVSWKEARREIESIRTASGMCGILDAGVDVSEGDPTLWFEVAMVAGKARLLLVPLVEEKSAHVLIRHIPGITGATVLTPKGEVAPMVQTSGVSFEAISGFYGRALADLVDPSRVGTNDVFAVLQTFGVEAARSTLVNEIKAVFGVYGITVDPRHLSLIADYMTYEGGYTALNRSGIDSQTSPILKMSFETTCNFLVSAATLGDADNLRGASAGIVLGQPVRAGTGSFGLRAMLQNK